MLAGTGYDVVVVGAGPAGSSAAFELASRGAKVVLVEKAAMPRFKPCGGGVTRRAAALLPFDISDVVDRQCFSADLTLRDAGLHFSVTRTYPLISMTMRDNFDHLLYMKAHGAGAHTMDNCRVQNVVCSGERAEVVTDRGTLTSRFVVAADGARSHVARCGGWTGRMPVIPLVDWEIPVTDKVLDRFAGCARFEFGPVPAGYAWIFPKKAHLSVGLGTYKPHVTDLTRKLRAFLTTSGIAPAGGIRRHGHFIPVYSRPDGFVRERIVLTGDAAGFVDPVTGEGITYAIESGQAAARALIDGALAPDHVGERYYARIRASILRELYFGRLLSAILYGPVTLRDLVFGVLGQKLSEAMADTISGERTYAEIFTKHPWVRAALTAFRAVTSAQSYPLSAGSGLRSPCL
jgi:geranylgeranyl reductase family protein